MTKVRVLHLHHKQSAGPEVAASAFVFLVLVAGAALLVIWLGLGR